MCDSLWQLLYGCMLMQWWLSLAGLHLDRLHFQLCQRPSADAGLYAAGAPSLGDYFDSFPGFDSDFSRDDLRLVEFCEPWCFSDRPNVVTRQARVARYGYGSFGDFRRTALGVHSAAHLVKCIPAFRHFDQVDVATRTTSGARALSED